jgi:hypothetical protein
MADDTYSRGYRNDPYDRGGSASVPAGTDPLTELARLIGQSDPFAPDRNRQPDPRQPPPPPADWNTDAARHAQHYDAQHYDPQHYDPQQYDHGTRDERYAEGEPQQYADQGYGSADQYPPHQNGYAYPQAGQHEAGYAEQAYHQDPQAYHQDQPAYQHQQEQAYPQDQAAYQNEQPAYHQDPQPYAQDQPRYASDHEAPYFGPAGDAPQQGVHDAAAEPHVPVPGYPVPPFLGSDPNTRPDEYYEDAPAPRRGWLVTAAALVGLAVIGTAGAFAYRAVFTGGEARMISRDVQPSKITPAQTNQDPNKAGERLASANQNERLGPPPEQPITIPEPPRTVPPALTQNPVPAPAPAPAPVLPPTPGTANQAAAPPADNGGAAPRRVRTEKINPQQGGDVSGPRPATQPRTVGPTPVQPGQPRVAATMPPAGPNAPLSLAPDTPAAAPAPAPTPPPMHTTAVAPPPAVERNSGGGSGYYVQVAAQKSEDEAKSTFRGIAARHASLLGGQQPVIRRKDLGAKGIFYGAQVGPFSRDAAAKLCKDLEAAGQGCMVQRN